MQAKRQLRDAVSNPLKRVVVEGAVYSRREPISDGRSWGHQGFIAANVELGNSLMGHIITPATVTEIEEALSQGVCRPGFGVQVTRAAAARLPVIANSEAVRHHVTPAIP